MNRHGVALLTVLWLVAVMSAATGATLALSRVGSDTTRNRVLLARSEWAREACGEVLLARYAEQEILTNVETIDLGRGTWCRATVEDAGTKLDVNRATPEMLRSVLGSEALADALLDWRDEDEGPRYHGAEAEWYRSHGQRLPRNGPLMSIAELHFIRGFDSARVAALEDLLTVRGLGKIDVNRAPAGVLAALPGFGAEAVAAVLARRGRRIASVDELLAMLSGAGRTQLLARYQDFAAVAWFAPSGFVVRTEGGVSGTPIASRSRLTLVPAAGRLAVVRREAE